jgi:hypothetical protein
MEYFMDTNIDAQQDLFISHANADKAKYILPLTDALTKYQLTFWLDSLQMHWGDNLAMKINEGLRISKFVILCLSKNFIERPWPETEMSAALSMQNSEGEKKVLPLILNSKEDILNKYPIIGGLIYREFREGAEKLASELAKLASVKSSTDSETIRVVIESIHTGKLSSLRVSPRVSVWWLADKAKQGAGLSDMLDTGGAMRFRIRWVLVDANAEAEWAALEPHEKQQITAIIKTKEGKTNISYIAKDRLERLGAYDNIVFHLYAVEDSDQNISYHA